MKNMLYPFSRKPKKQKQFESSKVETKLYHLETVSNNPTRLIHTNAFIGTTFLN